VHEALEVGDQPDVRAATATTTGRVDPAFEVGFSEGAGAAEAAEGGRFTGGYCGVGREGGQDLGTVGVRAYGVRCGHNPTLIRSPALPWDSGHVFRTAPCLGSIVPFCCGPPASEGRFFFGGPHVR